MPYTGTCMKWLKNRNFARLTHGYFPLPGISVSEKGAHIENSHEFTYMCEKFLEFYTSSKSEAQIKHITKFGQVPFNAQQEECQTHTARVGLLVSLSLKSCLGSEGNTKS